MAESEIPDIEILPIFSNLEEGNLVAMLEETEKKNAGVYEDINKAYDKAKQSMSAWLKRYDKALKLAKMQPNKDGKDIDSKSYPFAGASVAMLPFILEAMFDFHARAVPELVYSDTLVSVKVNGEEPPSEGEENPKARRSERVKDYLNYQLENDIPQWRMGQDKALLSLPCVGTFYKKTYHDYDTKQICSDLRMADKIIFDMDNDYFETAPDKFEKINYSRNELIGFIRGEQGWDISEDDLEEDKDDFDFVEAHCWIDLDEDGLKEPYYAVLYPEQNKIVCLYPDYDEDGVTLSDADEIIKIEPQEIYTQFIFIPDPAGGPMGMGWGILLGPTFTAINKTVRDNLDAGTLNLLTANSGLIATSVGTQRGNRQQSKTIDVEMGALTPIPASGLHGPLAQNVVQLPFAGPSNTLMSLTEYLVEASRRMTTSAYAVEANPGEAASLYLARLQQGLKMPNSIIMRTYNSAKKEFNKIALLNYKYHDSEKYNLVLDGDYVMAQDFDPKDCDITLTANPAQGSDVERVAKAQTTVDLATSQAAMGINAIDIREADKDLLVAMGEQDIERMIPPPPEVPTQEQKMLMAEKAKEAELIERQQQLREREIDLKERNQAQEELKQQMEAAKELASLGLESEDKVASITKTYTESLKNLMEMGASYSQAKAEVLNIEDRFIEGESNGGSIPQNIQERARNLA